MFVIPALRLRQEDSTVKASLGYLAGLRPALHSEPVIKTTIRNSSSCHFLETAASLPGPPFTRHRIRSVSVAAALNEPGCKAVFIKRRSIQHREVFKGIYRLVRRHGDVLDGKPECSAALVILQL